jgi:integrase
MTKSPKIGGWNKGKAVGVKRPFTLEQVQLIRGLLRSRMDLREIALFEVGISTVLRSSDLLNLRAGDVLSQGEVREEFDVRQQKTSRNVHVSLSEDARYALAAYIAQEGLTGTDKLWRFGRLRYSQIVKDWARMVNADPRFYSTHSIRRTYPSFIYKQTGSHEVARQLLGHESLARTAVYLGIEQEETHALKKRIRM